jgi:hypothetical protein
MTEILRINLPITSAALILSSILPMLNVMIILMNLVECGKWLFSVEEIDTAVRNNLKLGKAAGIDNIVVEHIIYAHPSIIYHLTKVFNLMIIHGYAPNKFGYAIIVPLIKDRCGDVCKLTNCRGISLSPIIIKLFETCLSINFLVIYLVIICSSDSRKTPAVHQLSLLFNKLSGRQTERQLCLFVNT